LKKTVAVVVAIVFVLAFAAPVFAQDMSHNAVYKMDGTIDIEKQVGHLCNTGAEMKQVIAGEGEMDKVMDVHMKRYVLTVDDKNDFVTADDAVRNLSVISVIELCAPAKHEYDVTDFAYSTDLEDTRVWAFAQDYIDAGGPFFGLGAGATFTTAEAIDALGLEGALEAIEAGIVVVVSGHPPKQGVGWGTFQSVDGDVLSPAAGYHALGWADAYQNLETGLVYPSLHELLAAFGGYPSVAQMRAELDADGIEALRESAAAHNGYAHWEVDALTDQIWAAHVQADPGFSGNLHQDFTAAYGPYEGDFGTGPAYGFGEAEEDHSIYNTAFGFRVDDDGYVVVVEGDDYVGNYFTIDQSWPAPPRALSSATSTSAAPGPMLTSMRT